MGTAAGWRTSGPTAPPSPPCIRSAAGKSAGMRSKAAFEQVAQVASDRKIELKDQLIRVAGDVAYEMGIEQGQLKLAGHHAAIEHRVTNFYQRQAGA